MPGKIDLFKAALGNEAYLAEINRDAHSQLKFINTLEENQFTSQDILELIQLIHDPRARTLLIVRLLGQNDYLASLKGESILNRIAYKGCGAEPSRLNAWIHQLDVRLLTPALINKLDPESAVSILCSVPHFHLLTLEQIQALLHRHLHRELIFYWVRHYAFLPNAHYVLAHLMKLVYSEVLDAIKEQEPNRKALLTTTIIEHLHLFHPLPKKFLLLANKESHLILAMNLYLNGHYYEAYSTYITQLTLNLLHAKHDFSQEATELLFALGEVSELKDLHLRTRELTNHYFRAHLKTNALAGLTHPLYRDTRLNIQKIVQEVHVEETHNPPPLSAHEMDTLIKGFIRKHQSINFFEYFLIHYCGDRKAIEYALNDYLTHFTQAGVSAKNSPAVQRLIFLLFSTLLDCRTNEALFSALLRHSMCCDERVIQKLFLYNPTATIQHFGLQGGKNNYHRVYNLCSWALSALTTPTNQQHINIAQQALAEAELELQFCTKQGLFSGLIKYIKRCWIYGWTGFFSPNNPIYVIPESIPPQPLPTYTQPTLELLMPKEKDMHALLEEMESSTELTQEQFDALAKALKHYALSDSPNNEFETRMKVHKLFNYAAQHHEQPLRLYAWLKCNQGPFMDNYFRLLALSFQQSPRHETDILLKQMSDSPERLMRVITELNCPPPQQREERPPLKNASEDMHQLVSSTTETFSAVIKTAQSTWRWALQSINDGFFTAVDDKNSERNKPTPSTSTSHL